jgi:multiple sugar transport system permease protein
MELKSRVRRNIALNGLGVAIACVFLFPLYWIFISSLKSNFEIFQIKQTFWPAEPTIQAYALQLADNGGVLRSFLNSMLISVGTLGLSMVLAIPSAYGLARFPIQGKKGIIMGFLVTQMLPPTLILTPLYLIFVKLKLINNCLSVIIADSTIAIPFIVLFLRSYYVSLPKGLEEAARIDGCTRLSAFTRIILPISSPGLVTAGSFSFIFAWNDLIYAITFMNKEEMRPMTAGIYSLMGEYGMEWSRIMAYGVILVIPVVIIFVFLQKYIIGGLTGGAIKG